MKAVRPPGSPFVPGSRPAPERHGSCLLPGAGCPVDRVGAGRRGLEPRAASSGGRAARRPARAAARGRLAPRGPVSGDSRLHDHGGGRGIRAQLARSLASERIHSAYLFTGPGEAPRATAAWFARALACRAAGGAALATPARPAACRLSAARGRRARRHREERPALPPRGRPSRPALGRARPRRHARPHRAGPRAQQALYLRAVEGGRRVVVIADAEWLNLEAQNALLRTLEEPPPGTTLVLVTASPSGLSRRPCARAASASAFAAARARARQPEAPEAAARSPSVSPRCRASRSRSCSTGPRSSAARARRGGRRARLLGVGSAWLRRRGRPRRGGRPRARALASRRGARLRAACRKALAQRNVNPQLVAERALLALREERRVSGQLLRHHADLLRERRAAHRHTYTTVLVDTLVRWHRQRGETSFV